MKPRKERIPEIHFYEWSVSRWRSSQAREELDAVGRSIYREMLDTCYTQGSVSSDFQVLSRMSACTPAEVEQRWQIIRRYFQSDKHDAARLTNKFASLYRHDYFAFVRQQKKNGKKRAKSGPEKPPAINDLEGVGSPKPEPGHQPIRDDTKRDDTKRDDTTATVAPPPLAGADLLAWPESVRVIQSHHPDTDGLMARKIISVAVAEDPNIPDAELARGLGLTHKRNQESAALWLRTIGVWVKNTRERRVALSIAERAASEKQESEQRELAEKTLNDPEAAEWTREWARKVLGRVA